MIHIARPTAREGYRALIKTRGSGYVFAATYLLVIAFYFTFVNLRLAYSFFSFTSLDTLEKIHYFFIALFDTSTFSSTPLVVLLIMTATATSLVVTQLYAYFRARGKLLAKDGTLGGLGLLLAVLGVGCAACGTLVVSTILGIFGYSTLLMYFPLHGVEIGYFGACMLAVLSYVLAKRLATPYTC